MAISELPVHPVTGLTAIGLWRNGAPIWPVLGGSGDDAPGSAGDNTGDGDGDGKKDDTSTGGEGADTGSSEDDDRADEDDEDDDKPLGPAGEKALAAEKERRRAVARARRQAVRERDEALAEAARLRAQLERKPPKGGDGDDGQGDDGPDLDAIRAEAEAKARAAVKAETLRDRVSDKIEVLAAKRAQDPEVVRTLLMAGNDVADFLDGDKVDSEAIKEALDELLENKPYLAVAAQGEPKRFKGSGDGGAKPSKPARPRSLGEAVTRHYQK